MDKIQSYLDEMVDKFNTQDFINNDPIVFPRAFEHKSDIEVAAFLASTIAWGNRKQIIRSCERMFFDIMKGSPHLFVMNESWRGIDPSINIHRTFFGRDLIYMCKGLRSFYTYNSNSLEVAFIKKTPWDGIRTVRDVFATANSGIPTKHISNPIGNAHKSGSACKRLNMMLRWLCRQDGIVDIGIWKNVPTSSLMIPLDVHVARIGRELGLIERKQNDRLTVEQLTAKLREICPHDPAKYDFALFGIGESQKHAML